VITQLGDTQQLCGVEPATGGDDFTPLTVREAKERLDAGWRPFALDVRARHEAEIVQVDWVDRLHPHNDVVSIAGELPHDRDLLVYCKVGGRSAEACRRLSTLGFDRLYNLEGGINAWAEEIDPSLPSY
jgi:adenylyltransferase/sulfurtransferase